MAMSDSASIHVPVLAAEVVDWLAPQPGGIYVDGTLGGGGHARLLAEKVGPRGLVIGIDRDPAAIQRGAAALSGLPLKLAEADYAELPELLADQGIEAVDGILLDLGLSSDQLADPERGFSFEAQGPLDLRFDPQTGEAAWQLLARLSARQLADLIYQFGEERYSRRIAARIVEQRRRSAPIRTARDLAQLVRSCVPRARHHAIDPATRTFQALRIAVNHELSSLETALERMPECLRPGGRIAIISFHSLEDRLVKTAFREDPRYMILTKKPIRPNEREVRRNPRSRSARLRVAERSRC